MTRVDSAGTRTRICRRHARFGNSGSVTAARVVVAPSPRLGSPSRRLGVSDCRDQSESSPMNPRSESRGSDSTHLCLPPNRLKRPRLADRNGQLAASATQSPSPSLPVTRHKGHPAGLEPEASNSSGNDTAAASRFSLENRKLCALLNARDLKTLEVRLRLESMPTHSSRMPASIE